MEDAAAKMRDLDNRDEKFRPNNAHFVDLKTGNGVKAAWSYPRAKYKWDAVDECPEMPAASSHVAILPAGQKVVFDLGDVLPSEGNLRVRLRAWQASEQEARVPSLRLSFSIAKEKETPNPRRKLSIGLPKHAPIEDTFKNISSQPTNSHCRKP